VSERFSGVARILFGAPAVLFGIILFAWHDAGAWEDLPLLQLPWLLCDLIALALVVGGVGIIATRALWAPRLLLAVTAIFALAGVPAIAGDPFEFAPYTGFFEFLSLLFGALALAGARRSSRIGLGICTISFAVAQIVYLKYTASLVPVVLPPNQTFWANLTTIAFMLAAIALLMNIKARLAARLTMLMLVLFGLIVWVPMLIAHPEKHFYWAEFALNYFIAGAFSQTSS
jgi:hypothetical protein